MTQKTLSAGGVVLNNKNEVLVVNQNNNSWSLPKGHIDPGESAREAAEREIYEETGVQKLEFIKRLGVYERFKIGLNGGEDASELKRIEIFLFKTKTARLRPIDPRNPEARWVAKDKVADVLTHPKDKAFYLSILPEL